MALTQQQLSHFNTFGFLIFRQLFSPEEVRVISREVDTGLDAFLPNNTLHDRIKRHGDSLMDANTPFIASLIDDPRFADVAEQLLDKAVIPVATDANYFVGDTGWHVDNPSFDYAGVRFISYLEPLDAKTGSLRVIPGSHREPFHSQIKRDTQPVFGVQPDELPAFVFSSQPGDVLAFNYWIWHAAFGGSDHRRMFGAVYYEDPQVPAALKGIQANFSGIHHRHSQRSYGGHAVYPKYWRSLDNPRHQRWVRRMDELGILETPGFEGG